MNKRKELVQEYEDQRSSDTVLQKCVSCGQVMNYKAMHRHHPAGRHGTNILRYIYICPHCHDECHNNPKEATERGLLWPGRNTRDITDGEWADLLIKINEHVYKL